jgi:hypothetical protein
MFLYCWSVLRTTEFIGDSGVNGRIILKWVLSVLDVWICSWLIWINIRFSGGFLWMRQQSLESNERRRIWLPERLSAYQGDWFMELEFWEVCITTSLVPRDLRFSRQWRFKSWSSGHHNPADHDLNLHSEESLSLVDLYCNKQTWRSKREGKTQWTVWKHRIMQMEYTSIKVTVSPCLTKYHAMKTYTLLN